jgi:hypothetical protein
MVGDNQQPSQRILFVRVTVTNNEYERFNDYPEREYGEVSGKGNLPLIIVEDDIVWSV